MQIKEKALDAKGCFGNLIFLGGVIVLVLLLIFGVPVFVDYLHMKQMEKRINYVCNSPVAIVYVIMALHVMITLYWLFSKQGLFPDRMHREQGLVCRLPKKIRVVVALVTMALYLGTIGLYAACYDQIDDNGLGRYRLWRQTRYAYTDVACYQLYAKLDGTLGIQFRMKDGSKFEYYGNISSYDIDESQYPNEEDDYVVELAKNLTALGVPCKVANEKRLYKGLTYDYWDDVAEKILAVSNVQK